MDMMTSSNGSIFCITGPLCGGIHRSPVNYPHKGQWHWALMLPLIWAWTNTWANNGDTGDLRRHCAHRHVIVMDPYHSWRVRNAWYLLQTYDTYRIMHELPWIMIVGSRVRQFANDFHEWQSHEWKSLANRITGDPRFAIHSKFVLFYFLHAILCP